MKEFATFTGDLERLRDWLAASLATYEARLAEAHRILTEYDHPLIRRRHRAALYGARLQVGWVPDTIERERNRLALTERRLVEATTAGIVKAAEVSGQDARPACRTGRPPAPARGGSPAAGCTRRGLVPGRGPRVGSQAGAGAAEVLWFDAAGHLLQHRAAFLGPSM